MKKIIFVLIGILLVSRSYSQDKLIHIERNVSEYYVDTLYSQIDFCYSNNSDKTCVLWIEKENVDLLTNLEKIRNHFFKTKGDASLMEMIWDGNVGSFVPGLFESFMKIIKPKDQFTVSFIKKGEVQANSELIKSLEKRIVIVQANEIKGLEINNMINMFNYSAKNVTILFEWLK